MTLLKRNAILTSKAPLFFWILSTLLNKAEHFPDMSPATNLKYIQYKNIFKNKNYLFNEIF